jgi:hypothetical protein
MLTSFLHIRFAAVFDSARVAGLYLLNAIASYLLFRVLERFAVFCGERLRRRRHRPPARRPDRGQGPKRNSTSGTVGRTEGAASFNFRFPRKRSRRKIRRR